MLVISEEVGGAMQVYARWKAERRIEHCRWVQKIMALRCVCVVVPQTSRVVYTAVHPPVHVVRGATGVTMSATGTYYVWDCPNQLLPRRAKIGPDWPKDLVPPAGRSYPP